MPSLKSTYKLWLRLQCQLIVQTSVGLLVRHRDGQPDQVVAQWPEGRSAGGDMLEAAREVLDKQRLHLRPQGEELLLGQPVVVDGAFWGSLVLRIGKRDQLDLQATLKLLQWGMTWLQFVLFQQQKQEAAAESRSSDLLELINAILREQTLEEAAITLTNQLATRLSCQRVALGLCHGATIELVAVSFSANFDARTPEMQAVTDAMLEAVEQRRDLEFPTTELPSEDASSLELEPEPGPSLAVLRAHEHLRSVAGVPQVHTLLLRRGPQVLAAVTLESNQPLNTEQRLWLNQALALLAPVFDLKQSANPSFKQSATSALAKTLAHWFGPSHLLGKLTAAAAIAVLVVSLIPGNYWVSSDAVLENVDKHVLVAPQDGFLASIEVRPGDRVRQSQVLAQLDDEDLALERRRLLSQMQQYRQEYDNALATSNRPQAAIASSQVEQAEVQLRLIEQQLTRVRLIAPIDGMVVSDDISQSLGAPVKQGDLLFEIAGESGYRVQLYVDERDIMDIATEQRGRLILTSLPGEIFDFTVQRITPVSEVREGRNYFRIEGQLQQESPLVRPGMTGSGRILAGRRALGWIWFHDLWDWVRLTLWL